MNDPLNTTPKQSQAIRSFQILAGALMLGLTVFALLMLLVIQFDGPAIPADGTGNINDIFLLAAAAMGLICLLFAIMGYRKKLKTIRDTAFSLENKLNQYRDALIKYMVLCEGPGLFSVIVFFLTGDYKVLIITAVMLAAMLFRFPQKQKIVNELALDWKEQQELD